MGATKVTTKQAAAKNSGKSKDEKEVIIPAPNIQAIELSVVGTAPYVQHAFAAKEKMMGDMEKPKKPVKKADRPPRDYAAEYKAAQHFSTEGWNGIPATAFRNAMIAACRNINMAMTVAKQAVFILPDGYTADGDPLVKFATGEPERIESPVRLTTGVFDIHVRAKFWPWTADVRVQYDADMLGTDDVANLLFRAGLQVGIGEGRPASRNSAGMGWGTFKLAG